MYILSCEHCMQQDCDRCVNCLDKPRNGGSGVRKRSCSFRQNCNCREIEIASIILYNMTSDKEMRVPYFVHNANKKRTTKPKPQNEKKNKLASFSMLLFDAIGTNVSE